MPARSLAAVAVLAALVPVACAPHQEPDASPTSAPTAATESAAASAPTEPEPAPAPPPVIPEPLPTEPASNAAVAPEPIPPEAILVRVDGDTPGDWFGMAVTGLGDIDGDGVPDLAAGAPQNYNWGHGEPGYVVLVSGATGERLRTLHPSGSLQIDGIDDHFGTSMCTLGDLDGDGVRELVVGSYLYDSTDENTGAAFVLSGATSALIELMPGEAWGNRHGWALAPIADRDGDGREDLLMGVEKADQGEMNSGSIQVFSSATFELLARVEGPGEEAHLGCSIVALPDVDGDGVADFGGGAFMYDSKSEHEELRQRGAVAVYSGKSGALLDLWRGSARLDHLGVSIATLGDADGDGRVEVVAGAFQSGYIGDYQGPGYARVYAIGADAGLVELRGRELGEQFGWTVLDVGDRDGDGRHDLLVGAPNGITVTETMLDRPGRLYLYSGADHRLLRVLEGLEPNDGLGVSAAVIGDLDGDGLDEVLVGAAQNVWGQTKPGYALVLSGRFLDCRPGAAR